MTSAATPTGAGQASADSQQPQAGQPDPQVGSSSTAAATTNTSSQTNAGAGAGQASGQQSGLSPEAERIIAELRKENAGHRTKLTAFEKAQADADAAKLSDLEKAQKRASDLEHVVAERTAAVINYEIQLAAARLNIIDPDAAAKLLDRSLLTFDETTGLPKNAEAALKQLIADKPYLIAPAANTPQAGPPQAPNTRTGGGAMSPARSGSSPAAAPQAPFDAANRPRLTDSNIWPSTRRQS